MMEKWKIALSKFLEEYEEDEDIIGAILCGSYATGNNNKYSDIDVYLISKDTTSYQERGNKLVNGFLIEYFINPVWKIKKYLEEDYESRSNCMANMLCYGKPIFDLTGDLDNLITLATEYIDKEPLLLSEYEIQNNNYHIWDVMDELKILLDEESKNFDQVFYKCLEKILNAYYGYLGLYELPFSKSYTILVDEKYRENYHIFKVPEKEFIKLYTNCFNKDSYEDKYKALDRLADYYYKKVGGFDINGFSLRNDL